MSLDDVLHGREWGPYDMNGNNLEDYLENGQLQRLLPDDPVAVGVDNRGTVIFAHPDKPLVYYTDLDINQRLTYFNKEDMFGGDLATHINVVSNRYEPWLWLSDEAISALKD